ncbi:MAG TPA: hypothetical protein VIM11_01955 [Tepidisphaeraceae bacterium]
MRPVRLHHARLKHHPRRPGGGLLAGLQHQMMSEFVGTLGVIDASKSHA